LLGNLDGDVQEWIRKVRLNGGVINSRIVLAGAEAIGTKFEKHKLERYGGHVSLTKSWARSLLRRMGFVKRKGTKAVKTLPRDFDEIKRQYVDKVQTVIRDNNVPDSLVINWD
jgi:hypothetical protein